MGSLGLYVVGLDSFFEWLVERFSRPSGWWKTQHAKLYPPVSTSLHTEHMKWTWNSRFLVIRWCYIHRQLPKNRRRWRSSRSLFSLSQFLFRFCISAALFTVHIWVSFGRNYKNTCMKTCLWCQSLPAESSSNWLPSLQDKSKTVDNWTSRGWAGGHGGQRFASRGCSLIHFVCSSLSATLSPLGAHLQPSFSRCHIKSRVHFWSEVLNLSPPICSAKLRLVITNGILVL